MKRRHGDAMRAKASRKWDWNVDGIGDDEQALEMLEWHDEFSPPYEASTQPSHHLDETLPF